MRKKLTATARHAVLPLMAAAALSGCSTESFEITPGLEFGRSPAQYCAPGAANLCGYTATYDTSSKKWFWCYVSHTQELDDCARQEEMTPREAAAFESRFHGGSSFFK